MKFVRFASDRTGHGETDGCDGPATEKPHPKCLEGLLCPSFQLTHTVVHMDRRYFQWHLAAESLLVVVAAAFVGGKEID
eukprot:4336689-Amphidinium_carterae.1